MIGESAVMQKLFAELDKVAPTKGRVLITGAEWHWQGADSARHP